MQVVEVMPLIGPQIGQQYISHKDEGLFQTASTQLCTFPGLKFILLVKMVY